jgi:chromosome segregation ATPase
MSLESRLARLESEVLGSSEAKEIEDLKTKLFEERKLVNKLSDEVIEGAGENAKLKATINAKDITIKEIVYQRNSHRNRLEGQRDKVALLNAEASVLEKANWHLSDIAKTKCAQVERLDSGINALADTLNDRCKELEDLDGAFGHLNSLFSARETEIERLNNVINLRGKLVEQLNKDVALLDSGINALADTLNDRCKDLEDLDVENGNLSARVSASRTEIERLHDVINTRRNWLSSFTRKKIR